MTTPSDAECLSVLCATDTDEGSECVDERDDIRHKFLVDMPQDFYDFWEFAKTINTHAPSGQFCFFCDHLYICTTLLPSNLPAALVLLCL